MVFEKGSDNMYKYPIIMYWSKEDDCYITVVPDLPGCMSDGKTPTEAIENTQVIIKEWIETALEDGDPIPEPNSSFTNPVTA